MPTFLILILTWSMDMAVPFLLIGQVTIQGQAEFSTAEYIKSTSNTSAKSGERVCGDLPTSGDFFPLGKFLSVVAVVSTCFGVSPHIITYI